MQPALLQRKRQFPGYRRCICDGQNGLPPSLDRFLNEGPPPIVFTLGSAVSMNAGDFFEQSLKCAKLLNRRAVLIVGKCNRDRLPDVSGDVIAIDYAPFTELFPRAAAIVHHGGVGTTGLAMRGSPDAGCAQCVGPARQR